MAAVQLVRFGSNPPPAESGKPADIAEPPKAPALLRLLLPCGA